MIAVLFALWALAVLVLGKRWLAEHERKRLAASITRLEIECGLRAAPGIRPAAPLIGPRASLRSPQALADMWRDSTARAARNYEQSIRQR